MDLHSKALGLKEKEKGGRVEFVGVDPEYMREGNELFDPVRAHGVREGERLRGYEAWNVDLYGKGEFLV